MCACGTCLHGTTLPPPSLSGAGHGRFDPIKSISGGLPQKTHNFLFCSKKQGVCDPQQKNKSFLGQNKIYTQTKGEKHTQEGTKKTTMNFLL